MEEYKKIRNDTAVPSLCFFLASAAAALFGYGLKLPDNTAITAGFIILFALAASLVPVYRVSLREPAPGSAKKNVTRFILLLLVSVAFAAATWNSIDKLSGGLESCGNPGGDLVVERVTERRYDKAMELRFKECSPDVRATATAPLDADIIEGDTINISRPPGRLDGSDGYRLSLIRKGIGYRYFLDDGGWTTVRRDGPGPFRAARRAMERQIKALFSSSAAPIVSALYFGNDDHLDRRTILNFKRAGVLHILAASGFNVGIVAFIPIAVLGLFRVNRKIIAAVCQVILLGYFLISDMPVSLFRAILMALLFGLFFMADMKRNAVNLLFLSAAVIIVIRPYELYNPGYQLSVGATLGILLFFPLFRDALKRLPGPLAGPLALTFSAQLPVIPIIALHMGEFNAAGIFSNIAVIPLTSGIMYCSLAANLVFPFLPEAGSAAATVADILCNFTVLLVDSIASLNLHYRVTPLDPVLACVLLLMSAPVVPRLRKKGIAAGMLAISVALPVAAFHDTAPAGPVIFEGKDSRAVLVESNGEMLFMGTLGDFSFARRIIEETAMSPKAALSLYLPDPDYKTLRTCAYIARSVPIHACTISSDVRFTRSLEGFLSVLDRDGVKLRVLPFPRKGAFFSKSRDFALDSQMKIMQLYYNEKKAGSNAPAY